MVYLTGILKECLGIFFIEHYMKSADFNIECVFMYWCIYFPASTLTKEIHNNVNIRCVTNPSELPVSKMRASLGFGTQPL